MIEELKKLFKEYSLTLDHESEDEWYVDEGRVWDNMSDDFRFS